ncbi:MAG: M20/M25/M40 family metallo-hydrolase, partial [Bacteroidales bacterium]|nr:M20/M25/M40 family metallo-hydrolase [Bacteroidales bacterium]
MIVVYLFTCLLVLLLGVILYNTFNLRSQQYDVCVDQSVDIGDAAVDNLSQAIRYKTISQVNGTLPNEKVFLEFHEYLNQTYPLITNHLQKNTISEFSLLYKWEGSKPELKPLLLLAHMDVVPVDISTEAEWKYKPFDGEVNDGIIWGRGTLDNKMSLIAIMEATELLLR